MPDTDQLEQVFHAALAAGDARGVEAALMAMAPQDPHRAQQLLDATKAALAVASSSGASVTPPPIGGITVTATRYTVSAIPEDNIHRPHFEIEVEYRGRGLWGVCRWSRCLDSKGRWDYESVPSEREDDWLATHRFDLDTALRLAREAAPHLTVNGHTVEQALTEVNP